MNLETIKKLKDSVQDGDKLIVVCPNGEENIVKAQFKKMNDTLKIAFMDDYDFLPYASTGFRDLPPKGIEKLEKINLSGAKYLILDSQRMTRFVARKITEKLENVEVLFFEEANFKDRPVVVIDSGLGGLNIVSKIADLKGAESYLSIIDNAMMPLGTKDEKQINRRMVNITRYIKKLNPKVLIIACNTIDAISGDQIEAQLGNIPVIRPIRATAIKAVKTSKSKQIGLLATENTVKTQKYLIDMLGQSANTHVYAVPCENLACAIENGDNIKETLKEEVSPLQEFDIDTLILGCTHYNKITPMIEKMFKKVNIIDSSDIIVENFINDIENKLEYNIANVGSVSVLLTKDEDISDKIDRYLENYKVDVMEF